jgi:hypothetical protein
MGFFLISFMFGSDTQCACNCVCSLSCRLSLKGNVCFLSTNSCLRQVGGFNPVAKPPF